MDSGRSPAAAAPRARGPLAEAVRGVRIVGRGFAMLWRERSLWGLSLVPAGFSGVALVAAIAVVLRYAGEIDQVIDGLWPVIEAGAWYAWLWVGPARAFFWILGLVAFLLVAALAMVVAVMIATVAAAPFLDALAWRAERLATGAVVESDESGVGALVRDVGRSIAGEARRLGFFLAITAILFGLGFLVPGAHVITGPAMVVVTILFLPLEYSGYVLDRRRVSFASRRRWIVGRWPRMAGFGAAAFAICFVPGMNLLMIPGLVVAGTLLVLEAPPADVGPGIGPAAARAGGPRDGR